MKPSKCNRERHRLGQSLPRTCEQCGLGPCHLAAFEKATLIEVPPGQEVDEFATSLRKRFEDEQGAAKASLRPGIEQRMMTFAFALDERVTLRDLRCYGRVSARAEWPGDVHKYLVIWWLDGKRHDEWLNEWEIEHA